MGLQHRMLFLPGEAEMISDHLAVARSDGNVTFFDASGPIFTFREEDVGSLRFAAAMLSEPSLGLATSSQVAKALGRHRSRVYEYRRQYSEGGAEALEVKRPGPRGPSKLKGSLLESAQEFLNEGASNRRVARLAGVSELTIRKGIKEGRLVRPQRMSGSPAGPACPESEASTPRARSDEDAACAGGVAVKRAEERALAPTGLLAEAMPTRKRTRPCFGLFALWALAPEA